MVKLNDVSEKISELKLLLEKNPLVQTETDVLVVLKSVFYDKQVLVEEPKEVSVTMGGVRFLSINGLKSIMIKAIVLLDGDGQMTLHINALVNKNPAKNTEVKLVGATLTANALKLSKLN